MSPYAPKNGTIKDGPLATARPPIGKMFTAAPTTKSMMSKVNYILKVSGNTDNINTASLPLRTLIAGIFTLFIVVNCATQSPESTPLQERLAQRGYSIGEQVKRIRDYRINGWSGVDRYNVILNVGASQTYLVTVRSPCEGLRSAEHLAFSTTVGELTDKDKLVVRSPGRYLKHCFIDSIYVIEKTSKKEQKSPANIENANQRPIQPV